MDPTFEGLRPRVACDGNPLNSIPSADPISTDDPSGQVASQPRFASTDDRTGALQPNQVASERTAANQHVDDLSQKELTKSTPERRRTRTSSTYQRDAEGQRKKKYKTCLVL
ncbi:hypothetical protein BaRGS_00033806 [Batillaria attramentaria]|uniref:Uncharacterized protein n=1 Tax=Batillaria attramentaria TaxID=370345 RepID=A0ABD0JJ18_9CAEN